MVSLSRRRPAPSVAAAPAATDAAWSAYAVCVPAAPRGRPQVVVQVLAWPTLAGSWQQLGMQWAAAHGPHMGAPAKLVRPGSWVTSAAPTLSAVFSESTALESSLANLIGRASIELAIEVVEVGSLSAAATEASAASKGFVDALTQFSLAQASARRTRCQQLVLRAPHPPEILEQAWARAPKNAMRPQLDGLRFDREPGRASQLPLEYCQLVAEASLRLLEDRDAASPIFDAIEGKVLRLPPRLLRLQRKKTR